MATRSAALFPFPDAAVSWQTAHAADASDATISISTAVPTAAKLPTDTAVSTNASDASNA